MGGPIFVVWGIYSGAKKVSLLGGSTLEGEDKTRLSYKPRLKRFKGFDQQQNWLCSMPYHHYQSDWGGTYIIISK